MSRILCLVCVISFALQGKSQVENPFEMKELKTRTHSITKDTLSSKLINDPFQNAFEMVDWDTSVNDHMKTDFVEIALDSAPKSDLQLTGKDPIEEVSNPFDISSDISNEILSNEKANSLNFSKMDVEADLHQTEKDSKSFPFWIGLISIILLAIIIQTHKTILSRLVNSITNENILKLNMRNENSGINLTYLTLYLIFHLQTALFIFFIVSQKFFPADLKDWWSILIILFSLVILKHFIVYVIGKIFHLSPISNEYNFTILSYNLLFGIILIPLNLLTYYGPSSLSPILLNISIGVAILLILLCYFRSILSIASHLKSNFFHFFLYLCTFEIVPVMVLGKLILLNN